MTTKLVPIFLSKQLVVNLGKDKQGQQKIITLAEGLQEVEVDIAEHWFVKAHSQEITPSVTANQELQDAYDALSVEHEALKVQSTAADNKIDELEKTLKAKDKELSDFKTQLAKAQASIADASKAK